MLKKISCELFKVNGQKREPIRFHKGLNIILGGGTGVNSIGKSTMLLIIDFVFGGNTYLSSDVVKQLGNHNIEFVFEFDGIDYRFVRSTAQANSIFRVDENDNILNEIDLQDFTDWLCKKYKMDLPGLKFRNTISRFFRIYGKKNYDEFRPLQDTGQSENQEKAIRVLVALYNQYAEIEAFELQLKTAEARIDAFRKARRYQFIPSAVDGMKKYEENIQIISELKRKKSELELSGDQSFSEEEVKKAEQTNEVRMAIQDARRKLRHKENDLHLISLNLTQGVYPTEADLKNLQEFFPEANLAKILDVERFHNKIQAILHDELEAEQEKIKEEIQPLKEVIESLQKALENIQPSMAFSQEFLNTYTELDRRIHKLEDENEAFETRNRLQNEKKQASDRLKSQTGMVLNEINSKVNSSMAEISDVVSQGLDNPPVLNIKEYNSYSFETPKDTGTGTNFKGMLIYDLAALRNTVLPAMAHDSLLFVNISYETVERILQLYASETDKQIFIAFDRADSYDREVQDIVKKNTVLKLDNDEEALFGWKWSRKETP
ncbi:MAG: DUF2326 domain-containing protein [Syntrophomonadaceae bacterium]|nr:DUF2326 domain-containing protein [Syntrophomonadaceae bacterium]